jgi:hypothetical protein
MYDYLNTLLLSYLDDASLELYKLVDVVDMRKLQKGLYFSSLEKYSYTTF